MTNAKIPSVQVATLDAFINTIHHDHQVCRWFLFMIEHTPMMKELDNITDLKNVHHNLKKVRFLERTSHLSFSILLIFLILFPPWRDVLLSLVTINIIVLIFFLSYRKPLIKTIVKALLIKDFPDKIIHYETLYEIGEFYSEKYRIHSLVYVLNKLGNIYRITLALSFIIPTLIYPLNIWQIVATILISLGLVRVAINTDIIFRWIAS